MVKGASAENERIPLSRYIFRLGTDSSAWPQNDKSQLDQSTLFLGRVVFCSMLVGGRVNEMPGAEDFGHGPGLGDTATWSEWRLPVKDFPQRSQSVIVEMMSHWCKIRQRSFGIAIDPEVCQHKRTE